MPYAGQGNRHETNAGHGYYYYDSWLDQVAELMRAGTSECEAAEATRETMRIGGWNEEEYAEFRQLLYARIAETLPTEPGDIRVLAEPAAPAPRPPRVHVRITRAAYGGSWDITCTVAGAEQDIVTTRQLRPFVQPSYRAALSMSGSTYASERVYSLVLESGAIPTQILADAFKAYHVSRLAQLPSAEASGDIVEDCALMRMQPATLLVGGAAYRLVPTGAADMRSPLRAIRRKAKEVAQAEARELHARATADAQMIVHSAELSAARIREQLARERAAAGNRAPEWLLDSARPFWKNSNGRWNVELGIDTVINDITMGVEAWRTTLHWTPALPPAEMFGPGRMRLALTLGADGLYTLDSVKARDGWTAPHINTSRVCMELQGLPPQIDSAEALSLLEAAISRGMLVVNMNSILSYDWRGYHPHVQAQIPEAVRKMLRATDRATSWPAHYGRVVRRDDLLPERITWQSERRFAEEASELFTLAEERVR